MKKVTGFNNSTRIVLFFLTAIFSFYGFFVLTGLKDSDVLEAENQLGANINIVTDNPLQNQNVSVQLNRLVNITPNFSSVDTLILAANPGPANNGGSVNWAIFMNLIGNTRDVYVTKIRTGSTATANSPITFEVYTRNGNALGGPVSSGPGSSMAGWTLIDTASGFQGPTSSGISEPISLGPIFVGAGDTVGVALKFTVSGPRYFGTGSPPLENYLDTNIHLVTGDGRSVPFTPTGSFFSSRALTGDIRYVVSGVTGITNLNTGIPEGYELSQNYPNPFNPVTNIKFELPERNFVTLKIFNSSGQQVAELVNGDYSAGTYIVKWDALKFSSGVYFYTLNSGRFIETKKLLLVK
ncbi:MAG: T9SS type A sorting domain-containing protein [Ignavibacteria bacterium]|nr:T9SS type A sorting domain-containing protein [Ignavibacteria bacterium]